LSVIRSFAWAEFASVPQFYFELPHAGRPQSSFFIFAGRCDSLGLDVSSCLGSRLSSPPPRFPPDRHIYFFSKPVFPPSSPGSLLPFPYIEEPIPELTMSPPCLCPLKIFLFPRIAALVHKIYRCPSLSLSAPNATLSSALLGDIAFSLKKLGGSWMATTPFFSPSAVIASKTPTNPLFEPPQTTTGFPPLPPMICPLCLDHLFFFRGMKRFFCP